MLIILIFFNILRSSFEKLFREINYINPIISISGNGSLDNPYKNIPNLYDNELNFTLFILGNDSSLDVNENIFFSNIVNIQSYLADSFSTLKMSTSFILNNDSFLKIQQIKLTTFLKK